MRSGAVKASNGVVVLSRAQIVGSLEESARSRTGLSARVMLRRYRQGKLADPNRIADLIALSNLLHKNDPILAGERILTPLKSSPKPEP
jgi:hypothetical protein